MSDFDTDKPNGDAVEEKPRYYVELVDQILTELEDFFATHLEDMFKKADDYLFNSAQNAANIAEQNKMFEAMNALRAEKQPLQKGYIDELSFYLQPVSELDKLPEKKQAKKPASLGLVENTEMDERVTLNGISSKAMDANSESIGFLIKRLKELSLYNDHIFHGEAMEPKRLCEAMHEAVAKTELTTDQRLTVYQFFNQVLIKDLGKLYDLLNDLLIENGILPEIEFNMDLPHYDHESYDEGAGDDAAGEEQQAPPPVPPGSRRAFGSGISGAGRGYAPPASGGAPMGGAPMGGAPMGGAPMGGAPMGGAPMGGAPMGGASSGGGGGAAPRRAFGSGMHSFSQAPQPYNPNAGGGDVAGSEVATGPAGQSYSAGVPVGQVRESIQNFVGGSHADTAFQGNDSYYSHQQVMTALTGLQEAPEDFSQTPLVFDANQIKKAVLSSIGESEGGAVTKAVHQVSEKTIDFIKLIFDAIIDEESITDEIKTLLLSLQIPVIKAAMLDSEFFIDDQHPARQLLDKIAEAGVGVCEHTDPVYVEIEKVVRKLLSDYDEDIIAFTVALDELKELTEEIYRKARETEAKSQKAVKMSHAKSIVLQEIRKITIGKELPLGIRTLVLKVWPSMMFNHYMAHGKANDEWVELLMILQKIIESVQPLNTVQELEELGVSYNDILEAAKSKLNKCRKNREIIEDVLKQLSETYEDLMSTPDLPDENEPQPDADIVEKIAEVVAEPVDQAEVVPEQPGEVAEAAAESVTEEEPAGADHEDISLGSAEAMQAPEPEERDPEVVAKEKIAMLPDGVSPGSWFIVYNGEEKPVRRLKLAVILVQDATMVFVDHLGNVVIEKDAEEFAGEIDKGLSGMIMQHSVFDHALHSALEAIDR